MSDASRRRRQQKKARQERKRYTTLIQRDRRAAPSEGDPRDWADWPIVHSYVPLDDCWRATGHGMAGIVRQCPDGSLISSFFTLSVMDGGISNAYGKDRTDERELDALLESMKGLTPPWEPGPPALASRYIWGAYAFSVRDDVGWPDDMRSRYLALVPPLNGRRAWWLEQFIGPNGLVPRDLLRFVEDTPLPEDLPQEKDLLVFTRMTFGMSDRARTLQQLRAHDPEFAEMGERKGEVVFDWTRKYPTGHWSPLQFLGGRQSLGTVCVRADVLVAEAKTLSMAALLVEKLKALLGDQIRLNSASWQGCAQLLREADREP